jgi:hypothetical protein
MNSLHERNNPEHKSGWVKKRSNKLKLWQKRFLVLETSKLKYYHSESDQKPAGIIDFDVLTVEVILENNDFILEISDSSRNFHFRTQTEQDARDWVYFISMKSQISKGSKAISPVSLNDKFWKFDRISQHQFEDLAETGDILLFRSKSALSKMQRAVTRGKYDHVALIVRSTSNNNLFLFEVTGVEGVALLLWADFMLYSWHNLYSRLTFKKIHWDRSEANIRKLNEFIEKVRGMDYKLSAGKLMRNRQDKDPRNKKGFFCSELIATAMKEIGILDKAKPSSKYWPGDFDDEKLKVVYPARVDNGLVIDFSLKN